MSRFGVLVDDSGRDRELARALPANVCMRGGRDQGKIRGYATFRAGPRHVSRCSPLLFTTIRFLQSHIAELAVPCSAGRAPPLGIAENGGAAGHCELNDRKRSALASPLPPNRRAAVTDGALPTGTHAGGRRNDSQETSVEVTSWRGEQKEQAADLREWIVRNSATSLARGVRPSAATASICRR